MDDLKLYGSSKSDIDSPVRTSKLVTEDVGMSFGIDKCGVLVLKRGKERRCEGTGLGEGVIINEIETDGCKYLGIIERGDISQQEMKESTEKEYVNRVRATLKSKLNEGKAIKAINTWAVATVRYGAGVINRTIEDLERIDRKTRKLLTIHSGFHPRSIVGRLHIPRNLGGRGLTSVRDCVEEELLSIGKYVIVSSEKLLKVAEEEVNLGKRLPTVLVGEGRSIDKGSGRKRRCTGNFLVKPKNMQTGANGNG